MDALEKNLSSAIEELIESVLEEWPIESEAFFESSHLERRKSHGLVW